MSQEGGFTRKISNLAKYLKIQKHFPKFSWKLVGNGELAFANWPRDNTERRYSLAQLLKHCDAIEASGDTTLPLPKRMSSSKNEKRRQRRERRGDTQHPWATGNQGRALSA